MPHLAMHAKATGFGVTGAARFRALGRVMVGSLAWNLEV
jgi:hypothetical protein